jgi:hypothetical protein
MILEQKRWFVDCYLAAISSGFPGETSFLTDLLTQSPKPRDEFFHVLRQIWPVNKPLRSLPFACIDCVVTPRWNSLQCFRSSFDFIFVSPRTNLYCFSLASHRHIAHFQGAASPSGLFASTGTSRITPCHCTSLHGGSGTQTVFTLFHHCMRYHAMSITSEGTSHITAITYITAITAITSNIHWPAEILDPQTHSPTDPQCHFPADTQSHIPTDTRIHIPADTQSHTPTSTVSTLRPTVSHTRSHADPQTHRHTE